MGWDGETKLLRSSWKNLEGGGISVSIFLAVESSWSSSLSESAKRPELLISLSFNDPKHSFHY